MSLYGAFRCIDGGWKLPDVAQSLPLLAPRLAPRDLVVFDNVRASENSIDRARAATVVSAIQPRDRFHWWSCVNGPQDSLDANEIPAVAEQLRS
jgi:hypothetical protein